MNFQQNTYMHRKPFSNSNSAHERQSFFMKYPPISGKEKEFQNLYSLLTTVNEIESEFCNGSIDQETHAELLKEYKEPLSKIVSVLKLSGNDIEQFMQCAHLDCKYAFSVVFDEDIPMQPPDYSRACIELGMCFTTLSDYCQAGIVELATAEMIYETILKIIELSRKVGLYTEKSKDFGERWADKLSKLPQNECVSKEIIEDLKNDIPAWQHYTMPTA